MDTNSKLWRSITGERPGGRTQLSQQRQGASYEQRVRNGDDAVRNNPNQR